jgi:uroporphyrinogen-III decarboxylase
MPDIGTDMEFEHVVKGVGDLAAYRSLYEDGVYRPRYEFVRGQIDQIGDAGVISIFGPPTPLLDLIMFQIRLPLVHYLLADSPREMAELLEVMHRRNCEYYEVAAAAPGEVVRSFEDTSTTLISPSLYREWCLHQLQDYRDICHAHGKLFVPHMCGFLKGVLTELRETGLDGIEAITPPPLGDTPIGLARERLGPDVTLIGGLDPTQFVGATPDRTRELIHEVLAQIGDGRRFALGHEEIHIMADLESVQVIPSILEEHTRQAAG